MSAACASSRSPGESLHGALTTSANTAVIDNRCRDQEHATRCAQSSPQTRGDRRASVLTLGRGQELLLQIADRITHEVSPSSKLGTQRSQTATDALADDALRAAELRRDLRIAALLEVVGLDRLALLGRQGLEQLDRRSECVASRISIASSSQLDRLHRERAPRLVLNRDSVRNASFNLWRAIANSQAWRRLGPGLEARHRGERGGERLGRKVERLLRASHAAPEEGEHRGEMPLIEDAERVSDERASSRSCVSEGCSSSFIPSYMTIPPDL